MDCAGLLRIAGFPLEQCEQLSERIDTLNGFLAERDLSTSLNEAMHMALRRFEAFLRRCLEFKCLSRSQLV